MKNPANIIAIDGPAASGKSTIGKMLADSLGYLYFDTGIMYRAVTWAALQRGIQVEDQDKVTDLAQRLRIDIKQSLNASTNGYRVFVDDYDVTEEIRKPDVDAQVSIVSAYPGVREALSIKQRKIGLRGKIVMVGRDIGTVVLPEADIKFFLEASLSERARRRYIESQRRGDTNSEQEILESMVQRDRIDSTREIAPLKPAKDAIIVNTDALGIEQVLALLKEYLYQEANESGG
jgi:cytidylate kinase